MTNLQELEQKYEELGKEIEKLKKEKKGKRWKPVNDDNYYILNDLGKINTSRWRNDPIDNFRFSQNNCFRTEQEALKHLENLKTKAELRALAEELNGDEVMNWETLFQYKYHLYCDNRKDNLEQDYNDQFQKQGIIYCLDPDFKDKAIERIGEDRLIKMIKAGV